MDGAGRAKPRPGMSKQDICEWKANPPLPSKAVQIDCTALFIYSRYMHHSEIGRGVEDLKGFCGSARWPGQDGELRRRSGRCGGVFGPQADSSGEGYG